MRNTPPKFLAKGNKKGGTRYTGFQIFTTKKDGKLRVIHRKSRAVIDTDKFEIGTMPFMLEAQRIHNEYYGTHQKRVNKKSVGEIWKAYKASEHFSMLRRTTQEDYREVYGFLTRFSGYEAVDLGTAVQSDFYRMRDAIASATTRDRANRVLKLLSSMSTWAAQQGIIKSNSVLGVKRFKKVEGERKFRAWTQEECGVVLEHAPPHLLAPVLLMMFTGLSPSDVYWISKEDLEKGYIERSKTGVSTYFKVPPDVLEYIKAHYVDGMDHAFTNSYGKPWGEEGISSSWADFKKKHPLKGVTLKGLRSTYAEWLSEAGRQDKDIAVSLGHKNANTTRIYVQGALNRKQRDTNNELIEEISREVLKDKLSK